MIAWADDNMADGIPGPWDRGDETVDDEPGCGPEADASLYFTDDDPETPGLAGMSAWDAARGFVFTPYGQVAISGPDASVASDVFQRARGYVPFAGYVFDAEAGPHLERNRTYQGQLGRWVQREPLGFVDGVRGCPSPPAPRMLAPTDRANAISLDPCLDSYSQ